MDYEIPGSIRSWMPVSYEGSYSQTGYLIIHYKNIMQAMRKTGPEGLHIYHRGYDPEASLGVSGR